MTLRVAYLNLRLNYVSKFVSTWNSGVGRNVNYEFVAICAGPGFPQQFNEEKIRLIILMDSLTPRILGPYPLMK